MVELENEDSSRSKLFRKQRLIKRNIDSEVIKTQTIILHF